MILTGILFALNLYFAFADAGTVSGQFSAFVAGFLLTVFIFQAIDWYFEKG